jgi:putative iron-dependent peroxidase
VESAFVAWVLLILIVSEYPGTPIQERGMNAPQPGILLPIPQACRYLTFGFTTRSEPRAALKRLRDYGIDDTMVVGLGQSVVSALGQKVEGLRPFPSLSGPGVDIPGTPAALWIWLRGEDRGELVHRGNQLVALLAPDFRVKESVDGFMYDETADGLGRDLSGYEDGTENPDEDEWAQVAFVQGTGPGLDGSSFVAAQRWVHELSTFFSMSQDERDNLIGRRASDNVELEDAPESAHVKRTAQEDFEPEAFVLRRSMPWADGYEEGFVFVAFGHSLDAFEAQLIRMSGAEDGVVDGLFRFSKAVTGGYFWCPPVGNGKLNLQAIGL